MDRWRRHWRCRRLPWRPRGSGCRACPLRSDWMWPVSCALPPHLLVLLVLLVLGFLLVLLLRMVPPVLVVPLVLMVSLAWVRHGGREFPRARCSFLRSRFPSSATPGLL